MKPHSYLLSLALCACGIVGAVRPGVAADPPALPVTASPLWRNVREFGAKGDGRSLDTVAIQTAIQSCSASGGGTVIVPAGVFRSGTLVMRSHVALWMQPGAVLLGSLDLKDYPPMTPKYRSYTDVNYVERSLIYADEAEDVSIYGPGTIDGQGGDKVFQFGNSSAYYKQRPYLLRFIACTRVRVAGLRLLNSPMWVQHYLACDDVVLDGLTVQSRVNVNNDGLDIDGCSHVRVSNCSITSGDDGIVLKSTSPRPCRGVTITNCYISSLCAALKCGTESTGGFYDIAVSNCVIEDTRLEGIALQVVDGGTMDGVTISNIRMRRTGGGIAVRLGNRARPYLAKGPGGPIGTFAATSDQTTPGVGSLRNVRISQVSGDGCGPIGCSVTGLPGHPVENVVLEGIRLEFAGGGSVTDRTADVPEKEITYPAYSMFGRLPAYGFYCRHVRGLRLDDVTVALGSPDARPGLVCDDVQDLDVRRWQGAPPLGSDQAEEEIVLRETQDVWVHGSEATDRLAFVQVKGASSRDIRISENWCRPPIRPVTLAPGVPATVVSTAK